MYMQTNHRSKVLGSAQVAVSGSEQRSHKGVLCPSTGQEQTLTYALQEPICAAPHRIQSTVQQPRAKACNVDTVLPGCSVLVSKLY